MIGVPTTRRVEEVLLARLEAAMEHRANARRVDRMTENPKGHEEARAGNQILCGAS